MPKKNELKEKDGYKPSAPVNGSTSAIFEYEGLIYNRPVGRGIVLMDHVGQRHLDEIIPDGHYHAKIVISKPK